MSIIRNYKKKTKNKRKGRPEGRAFEETLIIRIDKETKEKIKEIARKRNKTLSELIRKELIKLAREGR